MNFPEDLKYTPSHEWIRREGDVAYVGITDFAQSKLGDIVFVEVETQGESIGKDAEFGAVEAVKTRAELLMPVSGTVEELNGELEDSPELVNDDPYGKGWMVKIKLDNPAELDELLDAAAYKELTAQED